MNIAMIVNSFPSVSEKFIINQVVSLRKQGVHVTVFSSVDTTDTKVHNVFITENLEDITIHLHIPRKHLSRVFHIFGIFLKLLFTHPYILLKTLSVKKYKSMVLNGKILFFADYFSSQKKSFDIVHCQFGPNGLIGAFLKDCHFAKKLIVTFHGSDINVFPGKHGCNVYEYMFKVADKITCGTEFIKEKLRSHGCPTEKIVILPVGILAYQYPDVKPLRDYRSQINVLSVGRLIPLKGFNYAIQAIWEVKKSIPDIQYRIAGGGCDEYRNELMELIDSLNLRENIFLLGNKVDSEILDLYAASDIFIFPSIKADDGAEEGQGVVVQEAEAAFLPVIASHIGGIAEGLIDSVTGYLVPEKNSLAIAEKLLLLCLPQSKELRTKMGQTAHDFAIERYDCNKLAERMISIYTDV
ncbi:MAG: glycosyltransferase [Spirochaetaceae bacterium]|jgi:colanic acid/amylovoran biosynthesis glycosyltransferase|nr:glycosyltransferase [Spirochaetaceae bacterium]